MKNYNKIVIQSIIMLMLIVVAIIAIRSYYMIFKKDLNIVCVTKERTQLMSDYSVRKGGGNIFKDKYLKKGEMVRPLATVSALTGSKCIVLQVETEDGQRGYILSKSIDESCYNELHELPKIRQTYTYITSFDTFSGYVMGKSIEEIEKKYGLSDSIILHGDVKTMYFDFIDLTKDKKHYSGVFLVANKSNKIIDISLGDLKKYAFVEKLFLAEFLRSNDLFGFNGYRYDFKTNPLSLYLFPILKSFEKSFESLGWFAWLIALLFKVLFGIVYIFMIYSIPRLLSYPFFRLIWYNDNFSNGQVVVLSAAISLPLFYVFFLIISLNSPSNAFFNAIFIAVTCFFWYRFDSEYLEYNRCPNCNVMKSAFALGSEHTGTSNVESWSYYDVYKGTTETSDQIIRNYKREAERTVKSYDEYLDYRKCVNCGQEWTVSRSVLSGVSHQRF